MLADDSNVPLAQHLYYRVLAYPQPPQERIETLKRALFYAQKIQTPYARLRCTMTARLFLAAQHRQLNDLKNANAECDAYLALAEKHNEPIPVADYSYIFQTRLAARQYRKAIEEQERLATEAWEKELKHAEHRSMLAMAHVLAGEAQEALGISRQLSEDQPARYRFFLRLLWSVAYWDLQMTEPAHNELINLKRVVQYNRADDPARKALVICGLLEGYYAACEGIEAERAAALRHLAGEMDKERAAFNMLVPETLFLLWLEERMGLPGKGV